MNTHATKYGRERLEQQKRSTTTTTKNDYERKQTMQLSKTKCSISFGCSHKREFTAESSTHTHPTTITKTGTRRAIGAAYIQFKNYYLNWIVLLFRSFILLAYIVHGHSHSQQITESKQCCG